MIIGFIQFNTSDPVYQSSALIKQNYRTGENLYSTLQYYNELIAEQDSVALAESLEMSPEEASKIVSFEISTDFNDNDKLILYDEYIEEIDTSLVSMSDYKTFVENLNDYEYELQKIVARFTERGLFDKTLNGIVSNVSSIEFFKKEQQRDLKENQRSQEVIRESLERSDSLQKVYQKVLQINPELRENQTSITIGTEENKESTTKEYQLFLNDLRLRRELVELEREYEDLYEIIEVISINQNTGTTYNKKSFFGLEINAKYYYAIQFLIVVAIVLLALEFLRFIEKYKSRI